MNIREQAHESDSRERDERQDRRKRTLLALSASRAFERGDLDAALREIAAAAAEGLDVDRVSVWLFADQDQRLAGQDAYVRATATHERQSDLFSGDFPDYFRALYEHRCLAADDVESDARMRELLVRYFRPLGIRSTIDAPMRLGARVLGVVCHEAIHAPRRWQPEDEQFAASIADLASLAVESARLREARLDLERKQRELALLQRVFEIVQSTSDVERALQALAREIAHALGFSHASIEAYDEASQRLIQRAAFGWSLADSEAERAAPLDRALGGPAVRALKPLVLVAGDEQAQGSFARLVAARVRTLVLMPMLLGGRVVGVLGLGSLEQRPVDQHTLASAQRLADALATQVDRYRSIADARRLEERLRESQKLEALGTLAGGIAHDFNNLLTGILGHAHVLKRGATKGSDLDHTVDVIVGAAERAAELTQRLLGFARQGKQQEVPCDLHALIREVCALCSRTMPKNIAIEQDLAARDTIVVGDPGQLSQVLLNLALNARDAMPNGGRLLFETRDIAPANVPERPGRERTRVQHVCVAVTDSGVGIQPEHLHRVFDPFFTTKAPGKGSGMGLAMAYGIVDAHGGSIEVESQLGRGTSFRVLLPVAQGAAIEPARPAPQVAVAGTGHVLVVDDDELVADVAAELLRSFGYAVTVATGGAEALERYVQAPHRYDLVLLDLVMPRMGGRECLRALRRLDPTARVVVSSGWQTSGTLQEVEAEGALGFVRKPYDEHELASVVARALRTPRRP